MKILSLFFWFCFTVHQLAAQTTSVKKAQVDFEKAQVYLKNDAYQQAIQSLESAVTADPKFQYAFIQIGDIHRRLRSFARAKSAYQNALSLGKVEPRVYYGMAESSLKTGDYQAGLLNIQLFLQQYKGSDPEFIKKANKYLKDCEFASNAVKSPENYKPVNMGSIVNSSHRDYSPSITADGAQLIFCRKIADNEDFYISTQQSGAWTEPMELSREINTKNFNEGAQSISPDGLYLFFTGCNRPDGLGRCDIYVSHKEGNTWGKPFNLGPIVNSSYWDSQPAISPDGNTLYFVSNRPGGLGGYDIWKSSLKSDGDWTEPKNLGPGINTAYDEHTPFVHADGRTLYFSSDGWPGMGDKDIFMCRIDQNGQWGMPQNMGYPINTFNEETGLIVTPDGKQGLFSSNLKDGYGDMDLYQFEIPLSKRPSPITYVKGIVKDKSTGSYLEAQVKVINVSNSQTLYDDFTSKENGSFLAVMPLGGDYAFNVSANGYLFYSAHYELQKSSLKEPIIIEIGLEQLKVGSNLILKNIFFNTKEYALLPSSLIELATLTSLLKNNPQMSIEIQGHTDDIGNEVQNAKLSLDRAKSVYDYLITNSIAPARLTYKGYGEAKPIKPNDTAENRKQNRRTSFVVTKI